jgi:hypothetical protein
MIEGSGSRSIPLTSGSGSGSWRPKNMGIRWIRIRNTGKDYAWQNTWIVFNFSTRHFTFFNIFYQYSGLQIHINLMRIRIPPSYHRSTDPPRLYLSTEQSILQCERLRPSKAQFSPLQLINFLFTADPDLAFYSNADPEPASPNNADKCSSGSATILVCTERLKIIRA